jgi:hypothetical protein
MKKFFLVLFFAILSNFSLKADRRYFGEIEYLLWNFSQINMANAVTVQDNTNLLNFDEIRQEDHWTSGFRLSAETEFCSNLNTRLSWTRFHSKFKDSKSDQVLLATELLIPNTRLIFGGDGLGGPATSKWTVNFDTLDWDFGMPFFCNSQFDLFPFIGLKGSIIRQEQFITYENFFDLNSGGARLDGFVKEKNDFYGVGPKIGVSLSYLLSSKCHLDGLFASSVLCGKQFSPSISSFSEPSVPLFFTSKFHTDQWRIIPFVQCYLGFSWHSCICKCFPAVFGLGYEVQFFWDLWRTQNSVVQQVFITDAGYGALMLQGLTASLSVCF